MAKGIFKLVTAFQGENMVLCSPNLLFLRVGWSGQVVGSGGRVGSGQVGGWLDNLGIRLNSAPTGVEFGWSWD